MDNVKHCIRGLETYLPIAQIAKTRNRSTAIRAVLDAQEQLWNERSSCTYEAKIARAYHQASSSSALWARRSGLIDEKEVDAIIYDDLENDFIQRTSTVNTMESSATPSNIARVAKAG
jgi:hypothetical protein